jgi:(p)ppGpp synthase/HD superfamily hydrolase
MECIAQFLDLNIGWYFREKKIYSDLTKILNKSLSAKGSVLIRDRFGIRGILDDSTDNDNIEKLYVIHKTISNIISTKESKIRDNFIKWYTNHNMDSSKSIDTVLSIPFKMDEKSVKDYLIKPKDNGYRSLHFGLIIADYSQVFPGVHLEIQLRDLHMHEAATQGGAACWNKYKSEIPLEIREVFQLDSNTNLQLPDEDVESLFAKPLNLQ